MTGSILLTLLCGKLLLRLGLRLDLLIRRFFLNLNVKIGIQLNRIFCHIFVNSVELLHHTLCILRTVNYGKSLKLGFSSELSLRGSEILSELLSLLSLDLSLSLSLFIISLLEHSKGALIVKLGRILSAIYYSSRSFVGFTISLSVLGITVIHGLRRIVTVLISVVYSEKSRSLLNTGILGLFLLRLYYLGFNGRLILLIALSISLALFLEYRGLIIESGHSCSIFGCALITLFSLTLILYSLLLSLIGSKEYLSLLDTGILIFLSSSDASLELLLLLFLKALCLVDSLLLALSIFLSAMNSEIVSYFCIFLFLLQLSCSLFAVCRLLRRKKLIYRSRRRFLIIVCSVLLSIRDQLLYSRIGISVKDASKLRCDIINILRIRGVSVFSSVNEGTKLFVKLAQRESLILIGNLFLVPHKDISDLILDKSVILYRI